jgi:hypothetical protein
LPQPPLDAFHAHQCAHHRPNKHRYGTPHFKRRENWKCAKPGNGKEVNADPKIWVARANRSNDRQECFDIKIMIYQKAAFYARINQLININ